jgi:hypothetical protein
MRSTLTATRAAPASIASRPPSQLIRGVSRTATAARAPRSCRTPRTAVAAIASVAATAIPAPPSIIPAAKIVTT